MDNRLTFGHERAEVHGQLARGILPESNGEEDDVTLVTLHILQIFDDGRLNPLFSKEPLQLRIVAALSFQKIKNERLLVRVEGDHANG